MKSILILKASTDICGNEVGLLSNHCELLGMTVYKEDVKEEKSVSDIVTKYSASGVNFDYMYLCTHGDPTGFDIDMGAGKHFLSWSKFSQLICESAILNDDTILLLGCCKSGFFQVAADIMAVCNKINFVSGVKWTVKAWDLTTGFVVILHNVENKNAEPTYAAQKASLATDYSFTCYDRDEIEMMPQYRQRQFDLYFDLGWVDAEGNWIETDPKIKENTGH